MKELVNPYPTIAILSAMVRAGDSKAVQYVLGVLEQQGGSITHTATAIGVARRTVNNWRELALDGGEGASAAGLAALRSGFERLSLGHTGAAARATEARLARDGARDGQRQPAAKKASQKGAEKRRRRARPRA